MGSVLIFSGCGSKGEKSESPVKPLTSAERNTIAVKKRAEIEAQRKAELAERIASTPYYENVNGKRVYYKAEVDPSYVGGLEALDKFLKDNLKFPDVAEKEGMEGTVFVDFVVAESGKVSEVTASSHTYLEAETLFSAEALRVVNLMPDWAPGRQNGEAVDVKFSVPITFLLN